MPVLSRARHLALAAAIGGLLLFDVSSAAAVDTPPMLTATKTVQREPTGATKVARALTIASNQQGDPYRWGAAGPNAFDCSGLIYYSTHRAGFGNVPRTSTQQSRFMRRISKSAMRPGDFMFFSDGGGVYHAGIYAGMKNGRRIILHASRSGTPVKRDPVWTNNWFAGTLRGR